MQIQIQMQPQVPKKILKQCKRIEFEADMLC